jgi:hypothetical protein
MDRAELARIVERHRQEREALAERLGALRSGDLQVAAKQGDDLRDETPTHISELERLERWLTENIARYEALLGA